MTYIQIVKLADNLLMNTDRQLGYGGETARARRF